MTDSQPIARVSGESVWHSLRDRTLVAASLAGGVAAGAGAVVVGLVATAPRAAGLGLAASLVLLGCLATVRMLGAATGVRFDREEFVVERGPRGRQGTYGVSGGNLHSGGGMDAGFGGDGGDGGDGGGM